MRGKRRQLTFVGSVIAYGVANVPAECSVDDFSTISNLVTRPERLSSLGSVAQGKLVSTGLETTGQIPYGPSRNMLGSKSTKSNL
jgi:hypothetical protein